MAATSESVQPPPQTETQPLYLQASTDHDKCLPQFQPILAALHCAEGV